MCTPTVDHSRGGLYLFYLMRKEIKRTGKREREDGKSKSEKERERNGKKFPIYIGITSRTFHKRFIEHHNHYNGVVKSWKRRLRLEPATATACS